MVYDALDVSVHLFVKKCKYCSKSLIPFSTLFNNYCAKVIENFLEKFANTSVCRLQQSAG
jgi:hypothetical protein